MDRGCVGIYAVYKRESKIVTIAALFLCPTLYLLSPLYSSSSFSFPSTLTYLVSLYLPVAFSPIIFFVFSPSSPLYLPSLSFASSDLLSLFHFHSSSPLFSFYSPMSGILYLPFIFTLSHSRCLFVYLSIFFLSATSPGMLYIYFLTACHLCNRDMLIRC